MKKIDIGELVNNAYNTDDVIEWLATTTGALLKDLNDAIISNNMGEVGLVSSEMVLVAGVAKALNERVNGKKEGTVL